MASDVERKAKHAAYMRRWNAANRDKKKASDAAYYAKNKDRVTEVNKAWQERNADRVKANQRAHYLANREKVIAKGAARRIADPEGTAAYQRAYRLADKERARARAAAWRIANPEKYTASRVARSNRRRARMLGNGTFARSSRDRARQIARQRGLCFYCQEPMRPGRDTHEDHVIPIALGGTDGVGNIVYACGPCNVSKGPRTVMEWRLRVRRGREVMEQISVQPPVKVLMVTGLQGLIVRKFRPKK